MLAAPGTSISAYLAWLRYSGALAFCVLVEAVQTSRFAMIGAIPGQLVGPGGFLAILALATRAVLSPRPS